MPSAEQLLELDWRDAKAGLVLFGGIWLISTTLFIVRGWRGRARRATPANAPSTHCGAAVKRGRAAAPVAFPHTRAGRTP